LGFSLIKNRAPHGAGLVPTGLYFLLPVMRINLLRNFEDYIRILSCHLFGPGESWVDLERLGERW
jgi:hypothetical protein